jgi:hypothetical protein
LTAARPEAKAVPVQKRALLTEKELVSGGYFVQLETKCARNWRFER